MTKELTIFRCLNKQRGACNGTQSGQYLTPSQLTRSSYLGGGNLFGCVFTFCSFDNRLWFWGRLWRCAQSWRRSRPSWASTSDRQVLLLVPCCLFRAAAAALAAAHCVGHHQYLCFRCGYP